MYDSINSINKYFNNSFLSYNIILLFKSHVVTYLCPHNINYAWNIGFTLIYLMVWQIISGIILAIHFISIINCAYLSLLYIIKEVFNGYLIYYIHSYGASFIFLFIYIHYYRGLYYSLYYSNINIWITGCIIFVYLMAVGFLGYVIAWGEMSYWGATVITNLLSIIPIIGNLLVKFI